jgi:hypothetical protein
MREYVAIAAMVRPEEAKRTLSVPAVDNASFSGAHTYNPM